MVAADSNDKVKNMEHWKRNLIHEGFEWVNEQTHTRIQLQVKDGRWTARLCILLASGQRETSTFFVEDSYPASLQKCLLYVWRALSLTDRHTFDLDEAVADLRRFAC